jgi:hypothetical protein
MAAIQTDDLLFEVNLLFRENKNAMEAFGQITKFYEALNDFDKTIVRNIGNTLVSDYGLEDVAFGSLKTTLVQQLRAIPTDNVKDEELKNTISFFLVKIKYWLLKLLADKSEITSKEEVQTVTDKVNEAIQQIAESFQIIVTQTNNYAILNAADDLIKEINNLKDKELLEYKSKAGNTFVHKGIYLNKPKILSELGQRSITNETTEILKIKKIDMLSEQPRWDFLQGKKNLPAKMLDKDWLDAFHNRQVIIKPEDALMVTLRTTHTYTPNFDDKRTDCEVIKVLSVISPESETIQQMVMM